MHFVDVYVMKECSVSLDRNEIEKYWNSKKFKRVLNDDYETGCLPSKIPKIEDESFLISIVKVEPEVIQDAEDINTNHNEPMTTFTPSCSNVTNCQPINPIKNVAICNLCENEFKNLEEFCKHFYDVHVIQFPVFFQPVFKSLMCCSCQKKEFESEEDLKVHCKITHNVDDYEKYKLVLYCEPKYNCDPCKLCFAKEEDLDEHNKNVHLNYKIIPAEDCNIIVHEKYITIYCDICKAKFNNETDVYAHFNELHEDESVQFHCGYCNVYVDSEVSLIYAHCRQEHGNCQLFAHAGCKLCKICFKYFSTKDEFMNHISANHSNGYTEPCLYCTNNVYLQKGQQLNIHIENIHLTCVKCRIKFDNQDVFKNHLNNHKNSKIFLYKCPLCEDEFQFKKLLISHLSTNHRRNSLVSIDKTVSLVNSFTLNVEDDAKTQCGYCLDIMPKENYDTHLQKCHFIYKCSYCSWLIYFGNSDTRKCIACGTFNYLPNNNETRVLKNRFTFIRCVGANYFACECATCFAYFYTYEYYFKHSCTTNTTVN